MSVIVAPPVEVHAKTVLRSYTVCPGVFRKNQLAIPDRAGVADGRTHILADRGDRALHGGVHPRCDREVRPGPAAGASERRTVQPRIGPGHDRPRPSRGDSVLKRTPVAMHVEVRRRREHREFPLDKDEGGAL